VRRAAKMTLSFRCGSVAERQCIVTKTACLADDAQAISLCVFVVFQHVSFYDIWTTREAHITRCTARPPAGRVLDAAHVRRVSELLLST